MKKFLVGLFFCAAIVAQAQNSNYTFLNGPYGGQLDDMVNTPGGIIGASVNQGIVISNDGGVTWFESNSGITSKDVIDLELDPVSGKVYALTNSKLYVSTNNGGNWSPVASSGFSVPFRIKKAPNGNLFIIGNSSPKNVYRSVNGGTTWSLVGTISTALYMSDFEVGANGNLYAAIPSLGLYRSTNSGVNFSKVTAVTDNYVVSIAISGNDVYIAGLSSIMKSSDNGATWVAANGNISGGAINEVVIESVAGKLFYLRGAASNNAYSSTDGGANWTAMTHPLSAFGPVGSPSFSGFKCMLPVSSTDVYVSSQHGVAHSTDGGATWSSSHTGILQLYCRQLVMTNNGGLIFLANSATNGFRYSADDGQSWDHIFQAPADRPLYGILKTSTAIYAYGQGVIKSVDNGVTWTLVDDTKMIGKLATPDDGATLYASNSDNAIDKSTNGGASWSTLTITGLPVGGYIESSNFFAGATGSVVEGLYFTAYDPALPTALKSRLYRVNLNTLTASIVSTASTSINGFKLLNTRLYVSVRGTTELQISLDGGTTWTTKVTPIASMAVEPISDNTIYALLTNIPYLSTDGGANWVSAGNFSSTISAAVVSPSSFAYLAVDNGGVYKSNKAIFPPAAPTGLQVTAYSHNRVGLTWTDNSNNEDYFLIERRKDDTAYDSVTSVTANTISNPEEYLLMAGMLPETTYHFRVRAVNASGQSSYTNEVTVTTLADCLASSTIPPNRSWTATTLNQSGVGVFQDTNVSITYNGLVGLFQIDKLTAGASMASPLSHNEVSVTFVENCGSVLINLPNAIDRSNGNGTWNNTTKTLTIPWKTRPSINVQRAETTVFTLNASDPAPTTPTSPNSYVQTATSIHLEWTRSKFVETYIIERSLSSGSGFVEVAQVNHLFNYYVDQNLSTGTKYYYRIKARNQWNSDSAPSSETSVTLVTPYFESVEIGPAAFETQTPQSSAWADLDNDKDEDLIVSYSSTEELGLYTYRNKGDGTLEQVNFPNLADDLYKKIAVAAGDYNNDGNVDLLVGGVAPNPIKLLTNNGDGTFSSKALMVGARDVYTLSFVDVNKDGLLDFSYCDYASNVPASLVPKTFKIYLQLPDHTFEKYEVGSIAVDEGVNISSSWADYDNDGDMDVLVEEYSENPNRLYRNDGVEGNFFFGFTKQTVSDFATDNLIYSEGSAWGDYDNDGDLDVFVCNTGPDGSGTLNDMLYKNNGDGTFTRQPGSLPAELLPVSPTLYYSNGASWGDVDNDGDLDLFVARSPQSALYINNTGGIFTKYAGVEYVNSGNTYDNSAGFADFNKDGALDLYVQRLVIQPVIVSRNTKNNSGKWLEFSLRGTVSNRSAIGVRVTINLPGGKKQIREVSPPTFNTQNSYVVHFGLGALTSVASAVIQWPSGITQTLTNVAANQLIEVVEDSAGPAVTALFPADASTKVALNTSLKITFDEPPVAVAGKVITVTPVLPAGTPFSINATDAVITGNEATFSLASELVSATKYSVVIASGAFVDIYGNVMPNFTSSWSFTAVDNLTPVISSISFTTPVAKGFGSQKFAATVSDNNAVASVKLSHRGVGSSDNFSDLAGVYNSTTLKWEFTVSETFYNATGLEFYFTAADGENNTTREPATGVKQSLFETTPPVLSITAPATLISRGFSNYLIQVQATDNFGIATVKMSYRNTKNGTTYAEVTGALNGSTANRYDFSVPESAFNGEGLEFYFTATDATGNSVRAPLATDDPATYKVLLDNQAPVVGPYTPAVSLAKSNTTFTVKASDNLAVASVVMKYRGIGLKDFVTTGPGNKNTNGDYEFAVEAGWFDAMGIEYYFRGVDGSGNIGVSPDTTAATNKYHKTFVKYDGANLPKLDLIKGSTGASGYQIISVPLELSNKNIADNFEELGTADNTAFRFLRYHSQPSEGWDEYPGGGLSALARGEGYFLNSLNAEEITLLNGVAPAVDQSNLFELTLKPGWNQIGNPYTVQIQWKDVIAFNGTPTNVSTKLTKYDNGYNTTDPDGIIEPYKGGFVNVNGSSDVKLKVPFKGMTSGRTQRVGSDLSAQNWEMPFTITQGNISYNMGLIGMNEQASLSMDNFDLPMAPRLGEYVEATFDHPEHARKKFSQDVVPASDEFTWTFGVNSNLKGMAQLNWNNLAFGENEKELFLQDLGTEQVINMRQVAHYAFDPARSSRFRIYFGDDLEKKISPARVTLTPTPNPATSKVLINFSLPDQGAEHFVKMEIYDVVGRKMGTLINEKMKAGFYSAPWDATTAGEGMYVCRLAVITGETQAMITERIVIKK